MATDHLILELADEPQRLGLDVGTWDLQPDGRLRVAVTPRNAERLLAEAPDLDVEALGTLGAVLRQFPQDPSDNGPTGPEGPIALAAVATTAGRYVSVEAGGTRCRVWAQDESGQRLLTRVLGPGGRDRRSGAWLVPPAALVVTEVLVELAGAGFGWSSDVRALLSEMVATRPGGTAGATATTPRTELVVPGLRGELMGYQAAGVEYLADAMGLGKTLTSLATVATTDTWPLVVVCPASLRVNWQREIQQWFPNRLALVVGSGKKHNLEGADAVIISYELLGRHLTALRAFAPRAVICDESHYVKDSKAQRTRNAKKLAGSLPADGVVLCLSGTPVVNRPIELVGQLDVLGRLDEFGGMWGFARRYCDAKQTHWGWDLSGASNTAELLDRLRGSCMLRRLKSQVVTDLPPRRQLKVRVEVDLDAEVELHTAEGEPYTTTYRALEEDFVATMVHRATDIARRRGEDPASAGVAAELRAESREHFGKAQDLHYAAGMAKVDAVVQWVTEFLETSGEDNAKLLVFAHHRGVLGAVHEALGDFGAGIVWGGQDAKVRQRAVDRFQTDPQCRVLVCSIKAAGVGLNLTAAADVVFAQPIWTPAEMAQAESRADRKGQTRQVTAWQFVATHTVDERIYRLLDAKAEVVDAITDGADQGVLGDLLIDLAGPR